MRTVTIREAKAKLEALVDAAERGEQVVLMRGAKHVAVILPLSEGDLELAPRLTDAQAERFWRELAADVRSPATVVAESPRAAVAYLTGETGKRPTPSKRRRR